MILYEGSSLIDGTPIVVIATEDENPKTGRMLYTWILRQDRPPDVAAYDGSDAAICGDCKFRAIAPFKCDWCTGKGCPECDNTGTRYRYPHATRTCYVRLSHEEGADEETPPSEVWRKWKAGEYNEISWYDWTNGKGSWEPGGSLDDGQFVNRYRGPLPVRIGSYGDPAAVPTRVWAELVRYAKNWTGYTHLWKPVPCRVCKGQTPKLMRGAIGFPGRCRECDGERYKWYPDPNLKRYCMASVDTPEERAEAQALGWRTFFVVPGDRVGSDHKDRPMSWETFHAGDGETSIRVSSDILCPATDPHPKRNATCATCMLCKGTSSKSSRSIWEVAHGKNKENHTWDT